MSEMVVLLVLDLVIVNVRFVVTKPFSFSIGSIEHTCILYLVYRYARFVLIDENLKLFTLIVRQALSSAHKHTHSQDVRAHHTYFHYKRYFIVISINKKYIYIYPISYNKNERKESRRTATVRKRRKKILFLCMNLTFYV